MRHAALLWEAFSDGRVHCFLCSHHCNVDEGSFGFCGMRQNVKGELLTYSYGKVAAGHIDPIEKKPFYHFLPGSSSFSIAAIGCNFRCSFCQNFTISQRSARDGNDDGGYKLKPEQVVREAKRNECASISYTYTEPTVFFEFAYDTCRLAKEKGIKNAFVTNGYMTKDAIDMIAPYLDAANVDLKCFRDDTYKTVCNGSLGPVLDAIEYMKKKGIWVEVTTLVVPGLNDSENELRDTASFISSVDPDMPWHISRFHPDHKLTDACPTPPETLRKAWQIGKEEDLKYVYLGNVPEGNDTVCPGCGSVLVTRYGFRSVRGEAIDLSGKCKKCGSVISGVWK